MKRTHTQKKKNVRRDLIGAFFFLCFFFVSIPLFFWFFFWLRFPQFIRPIPRRWFTLSARFSVSPFALKNTCDAIDGVASDSAFGGHRPSALELFFLLLNRNKKRKRIRHATMFSCSTWISIEVYWVFLRFLFPNVPWWFYNLLGFYFTFYF